MLVYTAQNENIALIIILYHTYHVMDDSFYTSLIEALKSRREWLEKNDLPKLKDELRNFHSAFSTIYSMLLKKGQLNADPYKNEAKVGDMQIPSMEEFSESSKEQFSIRLSNYDNQLDFLVNFYQFSLEFFTLEKIRIILGLIKYIEWTKLSASIQNPNTRAMVEVITNIRAGTDHMATKIINESVQNLSKSTNTSIGYLKNCSDFNKQFYKYEVRTNVIGQLPAQGPADMTQIRKHFAALMPGRPFYTELIEEIIKEDSPAEGPELKKMILKGLEVAGNKPKQEKKAAPSKLLLFDGFKDLGSLHTEFRGILLKINENHTLLENAKIGFWDKFRKMMQQMVNKEPEPTIYNITYIDTSTGLPVHEKINYKEFCDELEKKIKYLSMFTVRGPVFGKLDSMEEDQVLNLLSKNITEIQTLHTSLTALDEYFKSTASQEDRKKIQGIKPDLSTIKNGIIKANQKHYEYTAAKEEEEQFKRMGIQE